MGNALSTLAVGAYAQPPAYPRGTDSAQFYYWARDVLHWASVNNLLSSPTIATASELHYPKPDPSIRTSTVRVNYQHYKVAFAFVSTSTSTTPIGTTRFGYIGLPRDEVYNWYLYAANKGVAFSGFTVLTTLASNAAYAVQLAASVPGVVTIQHSAADTRRCGFAMVGGTFTWADLMRFSTVA